MTNTAANATAYLCDGCVHVALGDFYADDLAARMGDEHVAAKRAALAAMGTITGDVHTAPRIDRVLTACTACADMVNGLTVVDYTAAPVEVVAEFSVCVDCMQFVAGIDAHERGEDYPPAVVAAMTAPDAAAWHLVNACGDDETTGHEYTCDDFSYRPCDTCASWLAGERHAVTALSR